MGITGLYDFIRKKVPGCEKPITFKDLSGKSISLDAKGFLYKLGYGGNSAKPFNHLFQMANLYCDLIQQDIHPIFVFDGKPPKEKQTENERRMASRKTFQEGIETSKQQIKQLKLSSGFDPNRPLDSSVQATLDTESKVRSFEMIQQMEDDLEKNSRSRVFVTSEQVNQCKQFLSLLGAWVVTAPGEAEAFCSLLNRLGLVDFVGSEDGDVVPFGAKKLIRGIGGGTTRENKMKFYDIDEIVQQGLQMTRQAFVDVCVLSPNDYNKDCHIDGMGMHTAYKTILEHGSIERFVFSTMLGDSSPKKKSRRVKQALLDKLDTATATAPTTVTCKWQIPQDFDYIGIRRIFTDVLEQQTIPTEIRQGNRSVFNLKKVVEYLLSLDGLSQQRDLRRQLERWTKVFGQNLPPQDALSKEDLNSLFGPIQYGYVGTPDGEPLRSTVSPFDYFSPTPVRKSSPNNDFNSVADDRCTVQTTTTSPFAEDKEEEENIVKTDTTSAVSEANSDTDEEQFV